MRYIIFPIPEPDQVVTGKFNALEKNPDKETIVLVGPILHSYDCAEEQSFLVLPGIVDEFPHTSREILWKTLATWWLNSSFEQYARQNGLIFPHFSG